MWKCFSIVLPISTLITVLNDRLGLTKNAEIWNPENSMLEKNPKWQNGCKVWTICWCQKGVWSVTSKEWTTIKTILGQNQIFEWTTYITKKIGSNISNRFLTIIQPMKHWNRTLMMSIYPILKIPYLMQKPQKKKCWLVRDKMVFLWNFICTLKHCLLCCQRSIEILMMVSSLTVGIQLLLCPFTKR